MPCPILCCAGFPVGQVFNLRADFLIGAVRVLRNRAY